eukprot:3745667-Pleurochrysis_carterae.AAC.1
MAGAEAEAAAPASGAAGSLAEKQAFVKALSLRQVEAVCEANALSSAGSRAEMTNRVLLALAAGVELELEPKVQETQTLAVATRWDDDDDADANHDADAHDDSAVAHDDSADAHDDSADAKPSDAPNTSASDAANIEAQDVVHDAIHTHLTPDWSRTCCLAPLSFFTHTHTQPQLTPLPLVPHFHKREEAPTPDSHQRSVRNTRAGAPTPVSEGAENLSKSVLRDLEARLSKFTKSLEGLGRTQEWVDAQESATPARCDARRERAPVREQPCALHERFARGEAHARDKARTRGTRRARGGQSAHACTRLACMPNASFQRMAGARLRVPGSGRAIPISRAYMPYGAIDNQADTHKFTAASGFTRTHACTCSYLHGGVRSCLAYARSAPARCRPRASGKLHASATARRHAFASLAED